ncbi:hypothetical protein Nepgr_023202 [Nepenthes gracilis]|uniref:Uncharacterized protein n=1 Tax=Nepenthes gracilis TaxID=150966 RepID=A0AAD3XYW3_NEPGR|nr:hypothetical protein Nepgr_023202 [Nepenthes gracilis]
MGASMLMVGDAAEIGSFLWVCFSIFLDDPWISLSEIQVPRLLGASLMSKFWLGPAHGTPYFCLVSLGKEFCDFLCGHMGASLLMAQPMYSLKLDIDLIFDGSLLWWKPTEGRPRNGIYAVSYGTTNRAAGVKCGMDCVYGVIRIYRSVEVKTNADHRFQVLVWVSK